MTPDTTSPTVQICRTCGGNAPVDVHFCPQCTKVLSLARQGDYFSFLGVPRKLNLDAADLERRFRSLSRQFHPDFFYNASPAERRASLERASYLNDAFRTVKQPVSRIAYLLDLEGYGTTVQPGSGAAAPAVPPSLLEEVFLLNEELDEIRSARAAGVPEDEWRPRLERARAPIERKRDEHEAELARLSEAWDRVSDAPDERPQQERVLAELRDRMLERNYIANLLGGIERELEG
jgi:molecular chaperone HscB